MEKTLRDRCVVITRRLIKDNRGWFLKVITGEENQLPNYTGEIYFTSATPNQSKGSHYHARAREWFTLVKGKALLKLNDIYTGERMDIELDGDAPVTVFIPPFVAHSVVNIYDQDFILCAYTDVLYDPTDTINYDVK